MSSTAKEFPLCHQAWEYECPAAGGIVVGVDDSIESVAAVRTGAFIARRKRIPLHAVKVIAPVPSYQISQGVESTAQNVARTRFNIQESELRRIISMLDSEASWTVEVMTGTAAPRIIEAAEAHCAGLIIVGRHPHGVTDRIFGGETTLQVMRMTSVPVLAVSSEMKTARTAVAAVDFSLASLAAAREAIAILGGSGTLFLTFVTPSHAVQPDGFAQPEDDDLATDLASSFRHFVGALRAPAGTLIEPCVLTGRTVPCVIEYAERVGADLIAAGSHARSTLQRVLLGSVSAGLVRNAGCPVLVAPPCAPLS